MVITVLLKQSVLSSFLSLSHVSESPSHGEDYGAREVSELCTRHTSQPHGNINSCKLQQWRKLTEWNLTNAMKTCANLRKICQKWQDTLNPDHAKFWNPTFIGVGCTEDEPETRKKAANPQHTKPAGSHLGELVSATDWLILPQPVWNNVRRLRPLVLVGL